MQSNRKLYGWLAFFSALLMQSFLAQAETRRNCNDALQAIETQQINFGSMAPTGTNGTVTVTPVGSRSATNVSLLGGSVNAGIITVTTPLQDCHCFPLRITRPDRNATLISGANNMPMNNVVTSPTTADAVTLGSAAGSSLQINVGADLTVDAAQAGGIYNTTTNTYTVRVRLLRSPSSGNRCP